MDYKKYVSIYKNIFVYTITTESNSYFYVVMHLFLQAVSRQGVIILFDENRNILARSPLSLLLQESSKLIGVVQDFLDDNEVSFWDIENIVVVHGPGSFTGIRTITLYVNTLAYIYPHIFLTPVEYFDLFDQYPIVKTSSKRDMFVKNWKNDIIQVVKNETFVTESGDRQVYGDVESLWLNIHTDIDYTVFLRDVDLVQEKTISPLYVKKPNIS